MCGNLNSTCTFFWMIYMMSVLMCLSVCSYICKCVYLSISTSVTFLIFSPESIITSVYIYALCRIIHFCNIWTRRESQFACHGISCWRVPPPPSLLGYLMLFYFIITLIMLVELVIIAQDFPHIEIKIAFMVILQSCI